MNTNKHISKYRKKSWPIFSLVNCNSSYLIYTVTCFKDVCADSSHQKARNRWTAHHNSVKPATGQTGVGDHFSLPGHTVSDMKFLIIDEIKNFSYCGILTLITLQKFLFWLLIIFFNMFVQINFSYCAIFTQITLINFLLWLPMIFFNMLVKDIFSCWCTAHHTTNEVTSGEAHHRSK